MKYSFDAYKKEHLRVVWLSGRYTNEQLKDRYYEQYKEFCVSHNMKYEPR